LNFLKFQVESYLSGPFPNHGASGRMNIMTQQFTDRVEIKIDEFDQLNDAKNQRRVCVGCKKPSVCRFHAKKFLLLLSQTCVSVVVMDGFVAFYHDVIPGDPFVSIEP